MRFCLRDVPLARPAWEGRLPVFGSGRPPVFWDGRPSSNYFARACALQQRYSKTCLYALPDPTNGSPRQNTGTEEVTPREARFHVVPSSGFMFSFCMRLEPLCPNGCSFVKGPVGTGLAVFLVEQATQARRHKTRLHSSSANSLCTMQPA